jgi:hypothetical protein
MQLLVIHRTLAYPPRRRPLQLGNLTTSVRIRTIRGAFSGALAATVWAFQQPLDKLVLSSRYDDVELLGRLLHNGPGWYSVGLAWHVQNGALFGAVYANLAPTLPFPAAVRGPAAGLTEHFVLWPLVSVSDRVHPARDQLPVLRRNRRAFAQATWRHLLFGFVLGEIERRLNPDGEAPLPGPAPDWASNGHGSLERAVAVVRD